MSEENHLRPKPMIKIGSRPVLWQIMKHYLAHSVNDFMICCGLGLINGGFFVLSLKYLELFEGNASNWESMALGQLSIDGELMVYEHKDSSRLWTHNIKNQSKEIWVSGKASWKDW